MGIARFAPPVLYDQPHHIIAGRIRPECGVDRRRIFKLGPACFRPGDELPMIRYGISIWITAAAAVQDHLIRHIYLLQRTCIGLWRIIGFSFFRYGKRPSIGPHIIDRGPQGGPEVCVVKSGIRISRINCRGARPQMIVMMNRIHIQWIGNDAIKFQITLFILITSVLAPNAPKVIRVTVFGSVIGKEQIIRISLASGPDACILIMGNNIIFHGR